MSEWLRGWSVGVWRVWRVGYVCGRASEWVGENHRTAAGLYVELSSAEVLGDLGGLGGVNAGVDVAPHHQHLSDLDTTKPTVCTSARSIEGRDVDRATRHTVTAQSQRSHSHRQSA